MSRIESSSPSHQEPDQHPTAMRIIRTRIFYKTAIFLPAAHPAARFSAAYNFHEMRPRQQTKPHRPSYRPGQLLANIEGKRCVC
jgi:hypothetical protein